MAIKLKRSESFYIREGWFEKAINTIHENEGINIFLKNDGIKYLGIGSNMVKGLKYWLRSANIVSGKDNQLNDFGNMLLKNDQYLDSKFSWFLIHYNLASNKDDCPIINSVFNGDLQSFSKSDMSEILYEQFEQKDPKVNKKSVDQDMTVFIKSYVVEDAIKNPEDNYACPLASLKLISKNKDKYHMEKPSYRSLSPLAIFYGLEHLYEEGGHFDIDESIELENSPAKIFNLDRYLYFQYLEDLRKLQLITINKTAGLNTVYIKKHCSLKELYQMEKDL